jgi:hypothetical protein
VSVGSRSLWRTTCDHFSNWQMVLMCH